MLIFSCLPSSSPPLWAGLHLSSPTQLLPQLGAWYSAKVSFWSVQWICRTNSPTLTMSLLENNWWLNPSFCVLFLPGCPHSLTLIMPTTYKAKLSQMKPMVTYSFKLTAGSRPWLLGSNTPLEPWELFWLAESSQPLKAWLFLVKDEDFYCTDRQEGAEAFHAVTHLKWHSDLYLPTE